MNTLSPSSSELRRDNFANITPVYRKRRWRSRGDSAKNLRPGTGTIAITIIIITLITIVTIPIATMIKPIVIVIVTSNAMTINIIHIANVIIDGSSREELTNGPIV